ncbi:GNAT family N-acetyltransferase [Maridesulfovibrio sp. FT414]|uniref:GNAT family N-acetyltransferase n=1 Tax=Maridesulfovibrio sp. FT414 TaxID=2979469 RepID=UPI003D804CA2
MYGTNRLILRQWRSEDYEHFARLNADPQTMRFFPSPLTRPESDNLADKIVGLIAHRGWGFWAVELPGEAPFIGFVGLHIPTSALPFSPCVEIGWRLDRAYWGHGYATEAAEFALEYGFSDLQLDEIVSFTAVQNRPSQAVMKRIGMKSNDDFFEHPELPFGHPLRLHVLCRLSRSDWLAQNRN